MTHKSSPLAAVLLGGLLVTSFLAPLALRAQAPPATPPAPAAATTNAAPQVPDVVSPEVHADRKVTFRLYAPDAPRVELRTPGDIPGISGRGGVPPQFVKAANGVWEATVGPLPAGAYRYVFNVNGMTVLDSRNTKVSETNTTVHSLAVVPGSELFDLRNVPHGAVASVYYPSSTLGGVRRMHVYTPPGYETSQQRYPVFYLLHGAGDVDHSWSSVGRAGLILDNLIAARRARPMVVVMPAGHTTGAGLAAGAPQPAPAAAGAMPGLASGPDPFVTDFVTDLMPYVEKHYRVATDRQNRAIAGLSMGGSQTLNIAVPRLDKFAYVGVFSSGVLTGGRGRGAAPPAGPFAQAWEQQNMTALDNAAAKRGLRLLWFATGKEDFLLQTSKDTVTLLKKHGFDPVFVETEGGHTWSNWRDYLSTFAPQLFQAGRAATR